MLLNDEVLDKSYDTDLKSFEFLRKYIKLKELNLTRTNFTDKDTGLISQLTTLRILKIADTAITDLDFLEPLKMLEILDISGTAISDISVFLELPNLKEIYAHDTNIDNLWALENLKHLRVLKLERTKVFSIEALSNIKSLEIIDLYGNSELYDIAPLKKLENLKELTIKGTSINQPEQLNCLKNLRALRELLVNEDIQYAADSILDLIIKQKQPTQGNLTLFNNQLPTSVVTDKKLKKSELTSTQIDEDANKISLDPSQFIQSLPKIIPYFYELLRKTGAPIYTQAAISEYFREPKTIEELEKQILDQMLLDFNLSYGKPFNIKIPLITGKAKFSKKIYEFGSHKFQIILVEKIYFLSTDANLAEDFKNVTDFEFYIRQIMRELEVHLKILSFQFKVNINYNIGQKYILINSLVFPFIYKALPYLDYNREVEIHTENKEFQLIYKLDKKYQIPVMNSIELYLEALQCLKQANIKDAVLKFWIAIESLACNENIHFTGEKRKKQKIVDTIGHVINFVIFLCEENIENKANWEEALKTVYKEYRCLIVHKGGTISANMLMADLKGTDYVEGGIYVNSESTITPGLRWLEATVHNVLKSFIRKNVLTEKKETDDNFSFNVVNERYVQSFTNRTDKTLNRGEYLTLDMISGGFLNKKTSDVNDPQLILPSEKMEEKQKYPYIKNILTKKIQTMPFNILIGENHLYDASVKIAQTLLKTLQYNISELVICFELPQTLQVAEYYAERTHLAIELSKLASQQADTETLFSVISNRIHFKSKEPAKTLLLSLFGKERIIAFNSLCRYCQVKKIKFYGIDYEPDLSLPPFNTMTDPEQISIAKKQLRSILILSQLEKFNNEGISTLMVIEQGNLINLDEAIMNERYNINFNSNFYFVLPEDKKNFNLLAKNFHSSIMQIPGFSQTLSIYSNSSLDEKTKAEMQGKAFFIDQKDLGNAANLICTHFSLPTQPVQSTFTSPNSFGSPVAASSNNHAILTKRIQPIIDTNPTSYKAFFTLITKKEYSKALRTACKACKNRDKNIFELIKLLLDPLNPLPISIDEKSATEKLAPLHYAALNGNKALYDLLVERGADVNLPNTNGESAKSILERIQNSQPDKNFTKI